MDNGVLFCLTEVNNVFSFPLKEYNNFEAGEGESRLDSHFAHISHKIVRWVRLGNDLESGEQVADFIKVIVWFPVSRRDGWKGSLCKCLEIQVMAVSECSIQVRWTNDILLKTWKYPEQYSHKSKPSIVSTTPRNLSIVNSQSNNTVIQCCSRILLIRHCFYMCILCCCEGRKLDNSLGYY